MLLHLAFLLRKPCGHRSPLSTPKTSWLSPSMAAVPGFKSQARIFPRNPISNSSHNWLHLPALLYFFFFLLLLAAMLSWAGVAP